MNARWNRVAALAVVIVGAAVWWAWPMLTRDDRPDVLVIDDGFLAGGRRSLELRARESGRTVRWTEFDVTWCDDPAELRRVLDDVDPHRVVLTAAPTPACTMSIGDALSGYDPVAVVEPGTAVAPADLTAAGFAVEDPEHLIGRPSPDLRLACLWWEACEPEGHVAVRDAIGDLTPVGYERLARGIVAAM